MEVNAFTVLPMSQRFVLKPGETVTGKITIVNPADATENFSYKIGTSPYGVVGTDYTADLVTDSDYSAIAKWITIPEPTGELKPNETKEVEFTITVPKDAPAGGQYAAITVASNNDEATGEGVAIQNIFEMASVIYARVDGKTVHEGEVLKNTIPGFSVTTPVTLSALINNKGNVHEDATFIITAKDFFTGRVILPTEENNGQYSELIMPDSTRQVERELNDLPALGIIKVNQTIYYNGDVSIEEKDIIICPIWFMVLVLLTLFAIITTIVLIIKKHRKKKKTLRAQMNS